MTPPVFTRRRALQLLGLAGGAAVLGPALAACGGSGGGSALSAETPVAGRFEGVTLKLLVNQPHVTSFRDVLAPKWREATGGTLDVTAAPYDQLTSKQILDVQSGTGEFDVFDYFYFGLGDLVDAGALTDLTDWIDAKQSDLSVPGYLKSIYDPYTLLDGRRYGLPYDGDIHILFYNAELFDRYKVAPPTTWVEYDEIAAKITRDARGAAYGAIVSGQQVPMILGCSYINRLTGYGGNLVDADGKPQLTSDASVAALEHLVAVAPNALPTPLQVGFDQANTAFLTGQGALLDTWTDMALRAEDPTASKIAGRWGAVSLPVGGANTTPRTALDAGFGLGISTASKNVDAAAAFIAWATAAPQNLAVSSTAGAGIDPVRGEVLDSPGYAKVVTKAVDPIREGLNGDPLVWPKQAGAPKLLQDLVDQLALAIAGTQTVEQSLEKAQASWDSATQ
ncbi:ABC transporter substrate-binding protein [Mycolicibacterium litorale]|uniref:Sugar ABC transporter substrate-binding protein n=1 Tax=Mycolicibacterium litorale TaxID=758802 RepID=A0AAD1IMV5_9MYCO|nr:extracellular solute-binding protein [Mycolicibacterium litorale]MCV7416481.1 extracellular solute-binding protein [Mycolicibacterium litorale]TDY09735.1 carbohydrate ABC transporter substrate-binding protein (CUT1 family) [Mycolicibacterium litorale]BBY17681.1 sugar ABC transporter substrate-binding protein [Mycolicibacterium litorale]